MARILLAEQSTASIDEIIRGEPFTPSAISLQDRRIRAIQVTSGSVAELSLANGHWPVLKKDIDCNALRERIHNHNGNDMTKLFCNEMWQLLVSMPMSEPGEAGRFDVLGRFK